MDGRESLSRWALSPGTPKEEPPAERVAAAQRSPKSLRVSRPISRSARAALSPTPPALARMLCRSGPCAPVRRRARSSTSAAPAALPATTAAAGRTQLRGSRMAESSQASSSSAAIAVMLVRVLSSLSARSAGGSTGASASRSKPSKLCAASLIAGPALELGSGCRASVGRARGGLALAAIAHDLLQLLDGAMDQHLGGTVGASHRTCDLAVVHAERKAHDQRLAAIVWEHAHPVEHTAELVSALDQLLGRVQRCQRGALVDRRGRPARAVAIEVGGQVVGDADQPRAQRPSVRFALCALEMPVGLQERLLGQVLGVVVIAHAVVGIAVDVAQMRAVEVRELGIELCLWLLGGLLGHSLHTTRHTAAATQAAREISRASVSPIACSRGALAPPSQSHCRRTHAQIRSVTAIASEGEERLTVGNRSGRPARMRTLRGRMRQ